MYSFLIWSKLSWDLKFFFSFLLLHNLRTINFAPKVHHSSCMLHMQHREDITTTNQCAQVCVYESPCHFSLVLLYSTSWCFFSSFFFLFLEWVELKKKRTWVKKFILQKKSFYIFSALDFFIYNRNARESLWRR